MQRSERRDKEQEWRDHQILKQQNRKDRSSCRGSEPFAIGEFGNHNGGRGQREREAENDGARRRQFQRERYRSERRGAAENLKSAEAEDEPTQADETLPAQFEADHEQQEDDAEFGDRRNLPHIVERQGGKREGKPSWLPRWHRCLSGKKPEAIRTKAETGGEKAKNGAELQPAKKRRHDAGRDQKYEDAFVMSEVLWRERHCFSTGIKSGSLQKQATLS